MHKFKYIIILILIITFLVPIKAHSSELDWNFFLKIFSIDKNEFNYFSGFNISNENLSLILYYFSNGDRTLTRNQFENIYRSKYDWRELSIYFGLPPIMFDDEIIRLRRPKRERMQVPLDRKHYKNRFKTKNIEEKVELNPGKYEYYYKNKLNNIEEKIEVKQNKYEYYYKSKYMEEKLSVHMVTNKYEYYYKNFYTGREIKKSGTGRSIEPDYFYKYLREEYEEKENDNKKDNEKNSENGIQFNLKFQFNF